ncbi:ATP-dependent RecD-like DNA helicase [Heliobacterium undosum]|uniref:ATP-dependent RecD2 DNA helicase n=1 Tax=Heliomicrobium undosum TaxID=121734 RepID=A0A845L808_9FIRM|nr:ATP-dependent RecD-like DNA helicase [Heliomicrobium undosum]MZP31429.1 ATP-dependent RecD-like DNA helicase [Heliomicrobium undosum]
MEQLTGELMRILFQQEAYTVAVFKVDSKRTTAVGPLLSAETGLVYALEGEWVEHPRFGRQFRFASCRMLPPTTSKAMEKFLSSGLIKGIGRKTAKKLVRAFGADVLTVLREEPQRLLDMEGLSSDKATTILESYQEFAFGENLMASLNSYGIDGDLVYRIFRRYGWDSLEVIEANPYRLALDLRVSFDQCDRIAHRLGFRGDEPKRLQAALVYCLYLARDEGHVYLPASELLAQTGNILARSELYPEAPEEKNLHEQVAEAAEAQVIRLFGDGCYLPELYRAERFVARALRRLSEEGEPWPVDVESVIATMEEDFGIRYAERQKAAFFGVASHGLTVITGGPGTGKTTIVRGLIALVNRAQPNADIVLCAPTGRAAKRLAETTGQPAFTVHKALGLRGGETDPFWDVEPLEADVVIVDEVSMVDIPLMAGLLQALKKGARLVLVGDRDQIPSVGPGQVLRDIIEYDVGAILCLNHIFRQAETSAIVTESHRIRSGILPDLSGRKDFLFLRRNSSTEILDALLQTVSRAIERAGYDLADIQVLSPMRFTEVGVWNLNKLLQEQLNPMNTGKREVKAGGHVFRTGDKVMQLKNNYEKDVFNGDLGFIEDILLSGEEEADEDTIVVRFDEGPVSYGRSEWDQLMLAYATTVHKAQGSEYPVVVMPMTLQHRRMLRRNLVYTAVTRARDKAILIGVPDALAFAVTNEQDAFRYSGLPQYWGEEATVEVGEGDPIDGKDPE